MDFDFFETIYARVRRASSEKEESSLVPETGLEPAHLSALDPKSSVSAISPLGP